MAEGRGDGNAAPVSESSDAPSSRSVAGSDTDTSISLYLSGSSSSSDLPSVEHDSGQNTPFSSGLRDNRPTGASRRMSSRGGSWDSLPSTSRAGADQLPAAVRSVSSSHGNTKDSSSEQQRRQSHDVRWECHFCLETFTCEEDFNEHTNKNIANGRHLCSECDLWIRGPSQYQNHCRMHTVEKKYRCDACGRSFLREYNLRRHQFNVHKKEAGHKCEVCGRSFFEESNLNLHKLAHTETKCFRCQHCGRVYKYRHNLRQHIKARHEAAKPDASASKKSSETED